MRRRLDGASSSILAPLHHDRVYDDVPGYVQLLGSALAFEFISSRSQFLSSPSLAAKGPKFNTFLPSVLAGLDSRACPVTAVVPILEATQLVSNRLRCEDSSFANGLVATSSSARRCKNFELRQVLRSSAARTALLGNVFIVSGYP